MFKFPDNLYTDVRIEKTNINHINYKNNELQGCLERTYSAAFIRIYDGGKWYYSSTTDIENIQDEIRNLENIAHKNPDIDKDHIVEKFQINTGEQIKFAEKSVTDIRIKDKLDFAKEFFPLLNENKFIKFWNFNYLDRYTLKHFISSRGSDVKFDYQNSGYNIVFSLVDKNNRYFESFSKADDSFVKYLDTYNEFKEYLVKCNDFLKNAKPVNSGKYKVILSPLAAGIFAHESFGHKSEADFMLGDKKMKEEWMIGKKVGADILSIIDDGNISGTGYTPFDDEGTKAEKTYLIKNGILSGRLHSTQTAASLNENLTGNARSVNFEYEPIVRMTNTVILKGNKKKKDLFAEVDNGVFVDTIKHGSGMSTFTMAPNRAYTIKNGEIDSPVNISVISGDVFETLNLIDGLSDEIEVFSFVGGGCGKMDQSPLNVGFGGPYVRIESLNIQ